MMKQPTVYELLKARKGDRHVARLVHALDELAARYEATTGYAAAPGSLHLAGVSTCDNTGRLPGPSGKAKKLHSAGTWDLSELQLPDPSSGALPLFPGISEFDALQHAAVAVSSQLRSKAERQALRSWLMSPNHFECVVQVAWLLLALVCKQDDPHAKHVKDFVFEQLSKQYVSQCLGSKECVENATALWTQAIADAACRLLRSAFPTCPELQDEQLPPLLQHQLRLWTTGVLPSDAAARILLQTGQQGDDGQDVAAALARKHIKAPFASMQPGPLVSSYLSSKDIKYTNTFTKPGLVTELTVPQDDMKKVQQQHDILQQTQEKQLYSQAPLSIDHSTIPEIQQQEGVIMPQATAATGTPLTRRQQPIPQQDTIQAGHECGALSLTSDPRGQQRKGGQHTGTNRPRPQHLGTSDCSTKLAPMALEFAGSSSAGGTASGYVATAAACVAAAASAAEQYKLNKQVAAKAAHKGIKDVQQQLRQLREKRSEILLGTRAKVQAASNSATGWSATPTEWTSSASLPTAVTDAQCKAQRQLMEGHLRHGEWRMAHTFDKSIHGRCLDIAAAVAASAPSDAFLSGNLEASPDVVRGNWAAMASSTAMSSNFLKIKAAAASATSTGSQHIKVTRAAKAIAADVQQKYAS